MSLPELRLRRARGKQVGCCFFVVVVVAAVGAVTAVLVVVAGGGGGVGPVVAVVELSLLHTSGRSEIYASYPGAMRR